jgi:hypothetical protein
MLCTYLIRRRNTRVTEATASSPTHSHRINTDRNFTQCKRATIHTADTLVGVANWLREWCQVCRACTHAQYTSNQYHLARVVSCRVVSCCIPIDVTYGLCDGQSGWKVGPHLGCDIGGAPRSWQPVSPSAIMMVRPLFHNVESQSVRALARLGCHVHYHIHGSKFLELSIRASKIAITKIRINMRFGHSVADRVHQWSCMGLCKRHTPSSVAADANLCRHTIGHVADGILPLENVIDFNGRVGGNRPKRRRRSGCHRHDPLDVEIGFAARHRHIIRSNDCHRCRNDSHLLEEQLQVGIAVVLLFKLNNTLCTQAKYGQYDTAATTTTTERH